MKLFGNKFKCDQCKSEFSKNEDMINHARHEHHRDIVKCTECGMEFVHEADRLHHVRKEHEEKLAKRSHKSEHKHETESPSPQDEVDAHTRNFSDNF
ncbi:MAG: hypothetical protein KGI25_09415 [Thaumarchaeota archaeon]|nr:hypothetical protein [Nitrososphaerota archaeon]